MSYQKHLNVGFVVCDDLNSLRHCMPDHSVSTAPLSFSKTRTTMHLLEDDGHGNLTLVENHDNNIPRYAILSHTQGTDGDEVTFRDLTEGTGRNKAGYEKIEFCEAQAASDSL
jgi:hypothetical protein